VNEEVIPRAAEAWDGFPACADELAAYPLASMLQWEREHDDVWAISVGLVTSTSKLQDEQSSCFTCQYGGSHSAQTGEILFTSLPLIITPYGVQLFVILDRITYNKELINMLCCPCHATTFYCVNWLLTRFSSEATRARHR
jgi:hypothetical protein